MYSTLRYWLVLGRHYGYRRQTIHLWQEGVKMPSQPKRKQGCPVCHQPMTWFGDHWVCVNVKAHTLAIRRSLKQKRRR